MGGCRTVSSHRPDDRPTDQPTDQRCCCNEAMSRTPALSKSAFPLRCGGIDAQAAGLQMDKTGTVGRCSNDVGIMTLPGGGTVAISLFVKVQSSSTLLTLETRGDGPAPAWCIVRTASLTMMRCCCLVQNSTLEVEAREQVMADAARACYDFFVFTSAPEAHSQLGGNSKL